MILVFHDFHIHQPIIRLPNITDFLPVEAAQLPYSPIAASASVTSRALFNFEFTRHCITTMMRQTNDSANGIPSKITMHALSKRVRLEWEDMSIRRDVDLEKPGYRRVVGIGGRR